MSGQPRPVLIVNTFTTVQTSQEQKGGKKNL
jgi:hypothetical protein